LDSSDQETAFGYWDCSSWLVLAEFRALRSPLWRRGRRRQRCGL